MENHVFKLIFSSEDDVYRILDLTDTSLVGITEMFENDDEMERSVRVKYTKEMRANIGLRAKIVGYGIFVTFDDENTKWVPVPERSYLLAVLRQMAEFFKENVIDKRPDIFEVYRIPGRKGASKEGTRRLPAAIIPSASKGVFGELSEKGATIAAIIVAFILVTIVVLDIFVFDFWLIGKILTFIIALFIFVSLL